MSTEIIESNHGKHVTNGPLTTEAVMEAESNLLRNALDERLVKIRPQSTPIDQLSRMSPSRPSSGMVVEYYTVPTKATEATVTVDYNGKGTRKGSVKVHVIHTDRDEIFDVTETVLINTNINGEAVSAMGYVASKPQGGGIEVVQVKEVEYPGNDGSRESGFPPLCEGSQVVRMGRAATELDVQTPQFAALPAVDDNYCQIFKMQVEQSTLQSIADKNVDWEFSDHEEAAIIDMRLGMEKNFIFGSKSKLMDPYKNENVYFTGGIWEQAANDFEINLAKMEESDLLSLCTKVFTNAAGSNRKILLAGSGLMDAISKLGLSKIVSARDPYVKWGLEFQEIRSNFGSLYLFHSEVFDACGHANDGFVVDPNYIVKYVCQPFKTEKLDLRKSGVRNTDAVVITEASCLVLKYPEVHCRVRGTNLPSGSATENKAGDQEIE